MLPRWHLFWGIVLTLLIWIFAPAISWYFLALFFLASFLIDFDHYVVSGIKTGKWKLGDAFSYHEKMKRKQESEIKRGLRKKGDFHFFHTIEFHIFVGFLGLIWFGFFYVFAGMVFHSLLDIFSLLNGGALHRREYFLSNWLRKRV